jgi:hypothetical protein
MEAKGQRASYGDNRTFVICYTYILLASGRVYGMAISDQVCCAYIVRLIFLHMHGETMTKR